MAIMKKMLFIINPRSGKEQIRSRLLEILDSFVKAGYGPSVYITQGPKDAEYQAARAKTKELVVCSGGIGADDDHPGKASGVRVYPVGFHE